MAEYCTAEPYVVEAGVAVTDTVALLWVSVIGMVADPVWPMASVAVNLVSKVPPSVGTPVTSPVVESTERPVGRPAAAHVYGAAPPVAARAVAG